MQRGFLILTLLFAACTPEYTIQELHFDTDADTGQEVVDPECFSGDACTANTVKECWEGIGDNPKQFLRIWGEGCTCVNGKLKQVFRDQVCEQGCIVNTGGMDWCGEDAP